MLPSEVIRELAGAQVQNMLSLWAQSLLSALLFFGGVVVGDYCYVLLKQATHCSEQKEKDTTTTREERKKGVVWCARFQVMTFVIHWRYAWWALHFAFSC